MSRMHCLGFALAVLTGCGSDGGGLPVSHGKGPAPYDPGVAYAPVVTPAQLTATVSNRLFPVPVGARWVYEGGGERIEVTVNASAKQIWGAPVVEVHDQAIVAGAVAEDTLDWYAQDGAGNVWYMGEDTRTLQNGQVTSTAGSWTAGVQGALPGVIMLASPQPGDVYRQEYLVGEAEDLGEVVSLGKSVTVRAGTFTNCVVTRDLSVIEPVSELKTYCPGVGLVLVEEEDARIELIEYSGLGPRS